MRDLSNAEELYLMQKMLKHFKGDGIKAQLLKGASGTVGLKSINILLTLVIGVLLARTLGPENYGVYAFVLSLVTLMGLPTKAGLPTLLVRETAKNQLNEKWGLIRGLFKLSNIFVFTYSLILTAGAGLFVWWQWGGEDAIKANTFLWALLLLPLIAYEGVRTGTLRGLRWVVSSQLPQLLVRPLVMILLIGSCLLLGKELTSITAIQFNALAALAAFIVGVYFLNKALPKEVKKATSEYDFKPWAISLLPLSLFAGLRMLDSQVSILLLGILGTAEEVGLFRVAATGATLVAFGLTAVNMALAPQVARLYNAGEMEKLQRTITLSTRAVALVSFPVALVLILWGKELITLVFGVEYSGAATALSILCVGQLVNASVGSVAVVLNMTGNDKKTLYGVLVALVSNVSLAFIMIPLFGINGAAMGYAFSLSLWNITLMYMAKKHTGLNTFLISNK